MAKTKKRGPLSAEVANALSRLAAEGRSIFHLADLTAATGWSRRRAVNSLHQLRRSGWIVSLARGTYLIVPLEAGPDAAWTEAEKIRALGGQRRYAISRDVYDLAQLIDREGPDASRLAPALPAKWEVKGLVPGPVDLERLAAREEEFRRDWEQNLLRLLPPGAPTNFDTAWRGAMALLAEVNRHWPDRAR